MRTESRPRARVQLLRLAVAVSLAVTLSAGAALAANPAVDAARAVFNDPQTAREVGLRRFISPLPVRLERTPKRLRRELKENGFTRGVHVTYWRKGVVPGEVSLFPDGKVAEFFGTMFDFRTPDGAARTLSEIVGNETRELEKRKPSSLRSTQNQAVQVVGLDEANLITIAHVGSDFSGRSDLVILTGRHGRAVVELISRGLHLDDATIAAQVAAMEAVATLLAQAIDASAPPPA